MLVCWIFKAFTKLECTKYFDLGWGQCKHVPQGSNLALNASEQL